MDDLKTSHIDKTVLEGYFKNLDKKIWEKLAITRGKVLEYLGLAIDNRTKRKVKMSSFDEKFMDELPPNMEGMLKTPASSHLFKANQECEKIPEDKVQIFRHLAKLL